MPEISADLASFGRQSLRCVQGFFESLRSIDFMNILVTGSAGHLGEALMRTLPDAGRGNGGRVGFMLAKDLTR